MVDEPGNQEAGVGRNIVHIGYHKTATSWFQRVYYPRVANLTYLHRKHARRAWLEDSALKFDPYSAREVLTAEADPPLILCEEQLSGSIYAGGLFGCLSKDVAERIHRTLPESRIVIFIRRQTDMIASVYNQYVREGGTHRPARFMFPERYLPESGYAQRNVPLFSFDHFEYLPLIRRYQSLFGSSNVHVFAYEAFEADPRGFVEAFGRELGLEVDLSQVSFGRVNATYTPGLARAARWLNRFTYRDVVDKRYIVHVPGLYRNRGKILEFFNRLSSRRAGGEPEAVLGRRLIEYIRERYGASNRELAEACGLPLEDYGYPC